MTTLFWVLIVLHVFLCVFLSLLVLVQNDKMGGLAGIGGMTSQSAFSTAGAATFIQKLTRVVAVIFFIVVFALPSRPLRKFRRSRLHSTLRLKQFLLHRLLRKSRLKLRSHPLPK